jgi:hypothetical protein
LALQLNLDPSKEAEIVGHADSTGQPSTNDPLSLSRADTVQQALEGLVLEPAVASPITLGFGEQFPIDTNATAAGRARNRRVEIRIVDRPLPVVERVDLLNPAASRTTVVGSVAPVPGSTHGVTVAQEAASDVRVRAILNPALAPGDRRLLLLSWTGATQDPAAPEVATMSRAAGQRVGIARLANFIPPIRSSSAQFTVWSVSAGIAPSGVPAITFLNGTGFGARATVNFTATVRPPRIITDADRPDLSGVNPTAVPDSGIHLCGSALAGGANRRWDITRRFRQRVLNPAGLVPPAPNPACFWTNQLAFPANNAEGNDDTHTGDETNNPYANAGVLTSRDTPADFVNDAQGSVSDTLEIRMHFQEFARLDLGGAWHTISPPQPWRFHLRARNLPILGWVNNASTSALDNAGF